MLSISRDVRMCVCVFVCLSVTLSQVNGLFAPTSRSPMSKLTSRIFLVSVLLSALVERCFVSCMQDLKKDIVYSKDL